MANLVRFDPWGMLRDLDRFFEDAPTRTASTWMPRIDVFSKENTLIVRTEVPGVDPEAIDVTVEGDTLTITGSTGITIEKLQFRNAIRAIGIIGSSDVTILSCKIRDVLSDGKLEPEQALAIVPPICEALEYAHGKGILGSYGRWSRSTGYGRNDYRCDRKAFRQY